MLTSRLGDENAPDIEHHWTQRMAGQNVFHLQRIEIDKETAQLHAIIEYDNAPRRVIIDYVDIPLDTMRDLRTLADACPLCRVQFDGQYLRSAGIATEEFPCPCMLKEQ